MLFRSYRSVLAASLLSWLAHAEEVTTRLSVDRMPGTEDCPSARALAERVNAIVGRRVAQAGGTADSVALKLRVGFERTSHGTYAATLRAEGVRSGARRIEDQGPSCGDLAEALAVTVSILADDGWRPHSSVEPAGRVAREGERAPVPPHEVLAGTDLGLELGGGAALGMLREPSPAFELGGRLDTDRVSAGLGALVILEQSLPFAPGVVDVSLTAAYAKVCGFVLGEPETARLGVCTDVAAGVLRGKGRGYESDRAASRPWVALGASVKSTGPLSQRIAWSVAVTALAPVSDERFTVDGLGTAYDPPPVGGLLMAGAIVSLL